MGTLWISRTGGILEKGEVYLEKEGGGVRPPLQTMGKLILSTIICIGTLLVITKCNKMYLCCSGYY